MPHVGIFNTNYCSYNGTDFDPHTLVSVTYMHYFKQISVQFLIMSSLIRCY